MARQRLNKLLLAYYNTNSLYYLNSLAILIKKDISFTSEAAGSGAKRPAVLAAGGKGGNPRAKHIIASIEIKISKSIHSF